MVDGGYRGNVHSCNEKCSQEFEVLGAWDVNRIAIRKKVVRKRVVSSEEESSEEESRRVRVEGESVTFREVGDICYPKTNLEPLMQRSL